MNDKQAKHTPLYDAIKKPISMQGQVLLQWGFTTEHSWAEYSIQMPEDLADQILLWRDSHDQLVKALKAMYEATFKYQNQGDEQLSGAINLTIRALRAAGVEL